MHQIYLTREQISEIHRQTSRHSADAVLVTAASVRGDVTVALLTEDGSNLETIAIDSLGEQDPV